MIEDERLIRGQRVEIDARLAADRADAGVRIQHVRRGVSVEIENRIQVELVVALQRMREVEVFHRSKPDDLRDAGDLRFRKRAPRTAFVVARFLHDRPGAHDGLLQQISQLHRSPLTGLERSSAGGEHVPETEVLHLHIGVHEPQRPRRGEEHFEMLLLRKTDHVENPLRSERFHAVQDRGQIGRGVVESSVRLPHDQRKRLSLAGLELIEEHAERPFALTNHPVPARSLHVSQPTNDFVHQLGVETLPAVDQAHAESIADRMTMSKRFVAERLPNLPRERIAALQQDDRLPRFRSERVVGVESRLGLHVEPFQVRDFEFVGLLRDVWSNRAKMRDQHAELRAPVADVILTNDVVSLKLHHAGDAIADHRAPQMPDMHLLSQVRAGKVDDDGLHARRSGNAHSVCIGRLRAWNAGKLACYEVRPQSKVDKPRTGDLRRFT